MYMYICIYTNTDSIQTNIDSYKNTDTNTNTYTNTDANENENTN